VITAAKFGLAPGFCVTPDNLVALANYRSAAVIESAYITVNTGERISADAVKAAIADTLQLDTEDLAMYLFAGEMVIWERELSALDPEARRVALDEFEDNSHDVDIEQFRPVIERAEQVRDEVLRLEELYREQHD
jgi:hypothetical protein